MPDTVPKIRLPCRLKALIDACMKLCDSGCCGIDAYDFSPLHIASHLSAYTGVVSDSDINEINREIANLVDSVKDNPANAVGFVCLIEGMNQYFTKEALDDFAAKLRKNMRLAPKVLEFSNALQDEGTPSTREAPKE